MGQSFFDRARSGVKRLLKGDDTGSVAPAVQSAQQVLSTLDSISNNALEKVARQRGFDLVKRHYYSPIPDAADCSAPGFWEQMTPLAGVNMGEEEAVRLLRDVFPASLHEFRSRYAVRETEATPGQFFVVNGVYMAVDAHVYYSFVRHLKPKRIIEIGSGQSTRIALDACRTNAETDLVNAQVTAIEPYPGPFLKELAREGALDLIEAKVQDVDLSFFDCLGSGDILFIDSTHVLREGNDVQFEYLELLPRLREGVYVHVHDISLPRRYPKVYFDQGTFWNEQYLLQAFLAFNERFEVVWAGNHMLISHPEEVLAAFPEIVAMREKYPMSEPSAFWMRTR